MDDSERIGVHNRTRVTGAAINNAEPEIARHNSTCCMPLDFAQAAGRQEHILECFASPAGRRFATGQETRTEPVLSAVILLTSVHINLTTGESAAISLAAIPSNSWP